MKRRITLSIALLLCVVLVSLMSSDSSVDAQQNQIKVIADTGVVTLGFNQVLRVTADGKFGTETETVIRFGQIEYTQSACNGPVCKLTVSSQSAGNPIPLKPGEAYSFDVGPDIQGNGVRAVVWSSSRNLRVTVAIINTSTGETTSHIIVANTEGDIH